MEWLSVVDGWLPESTNHRRGHMHVASPSPSLFLSLSFSIPISLPPSATPDHPPPPPPVAPHHHPQSPLPSPTPTTNHHPLILSLFLFLLFSLLSFSPSRRSMAMEWTSTSFLHWPTTGEATCMWPLCLLLSLPLSPLWFLCHHRLPPLAIPYHHPRLRPLSSAPTTIHHPLILSLPFSLSSLSPLVERPYLCGHSISSLPSLSLSTRSSSVLLSATLSYPPPPSPAPTTIHHPLVLSLPLCLSSLSPPRWPVATPWLSEASSEDFARKTKRKEEEKKKKLK